MKLINDYTKQELIALTPKEVERIIHLHLADAGIAIPREPQEPNYEVIPEQDKKLFGIAGIDNVYFEKRETAEEVVKLLKQNFSQLRRVGYNYWDGDRAEKVEPFSVDRYSRSEPSSNAIVVEEKTVYSADLYMQIKSKLEANKKLKEDYEKRKEQYDKAQSEAKETIDMVWETVRTAQREQEEKDSKLATYREYLSLAEGDTDVAWKFMKKAHTVTQEQEDYINATVEATKEVENE